ncbi:hypothetical protein F5B17DRAFT_301299 [Nemania serpens]|nr:hypothetical protein F5B17DRAFT_301299 [Nemania serpens]
MNVRWTSEDIVLFRLDRDFFSPDDVLLRVFVSLPFGSQYKESPAECYDIELHTHRYPRILYLGIILLEIGLGKAIEIGSYQEYGGVECANRVHYQARLKLKELKNAKWDDFASKDGFVEAVENCLNSVNFSETINGRKSRHKSDPGEKSYISERRDVLYRKVVAPLFRLAAVGFRDSDGSPLIQIPIKGSGKSISASDAELQSSWGETHHARASFLSGLLGSSSGFLDHLQAIAGHITRCRRLAKTTTPVRVAILDTGCQNELPFFKDDRRRNRLRGWKDFTKTGSQNAIDAFGHGTFMARLIMHVAPIADIYVIRVAENTQDLEYHEQQIVNVSGMLLASAT